MILILNSRLLQNTDSILHKSIKLTTKTDNEKKNRLDTNKNKLSIVFLSSDRVVY